MAYYVSQDDLLSFKFEIQLLASSIDKSVKMKYFHFALSLKLMNIIVIIKEFFSFSTDASTEWELSAFNT